MRRSLLRALSIAASLLRQRPAELAAGLERRVVGRVAAGDALAHEVQPRVAAVLLPAAHPLAVAPAVGAEQRRTLAAEAALARVEHRLEFHFLQHLAAHGRAAEGDGVVGVQITGLYLVGREQHSLRACGGHSLGHSLRHGLRIARTAPVNNSSFHIRMFPTMKTLEPKRAENKAEKAAVNGSAEDATVSAPSVQIDLSKVKIEPLFADDVDFETFSKSDFRVVKIEACEAVPKSKKLLKFTLNDGTDRKRTILSGIHEYYEPEELVGKTCVAITNLPPRKMMGIDSEGMLISAVYEYDGREGLNLLMLDDSIPAGAKLY